MGKDKQETLYGGSVGGDYTAPATTFVKVYEEVQEVGETFTLTLSGCALNESEGRLTLFDNTNDEETTATTVYFNHHPNAKFTDSTPDGVRLGQAVARCVGPLTSNADLAQNIQERDLVLTVEGVEFNGGFARLWTVDNA